MNKYKVIVPLEFVMGHLRNGHEEYYVSAESEEEALAIAMKDECYSEIVVDDYEIEDGGDKYWDEASVELLKDNEEAD